MKTHRRTKKRGGGLHRNSPNNTKRDQRGELSNDDIKKAATNYYSLLGGPHSLSSEAKARATEIERAEIERLGDRAVARIRKERDEKRRAEQERLDVLTNTPNVMNITMAMNFVRQINKDYINVPDEELMFNINNTSQVSVNGRVRISKTLLMDAMKVGFDWRNIHLNNYGGKRRKTRRHRKKKAKTTHHKKKRKSRRRRR